LAELPKEDETQLIPLSWIVEAQRRAPPKDWAAAPLRVGIDVARSAGGDQTVVQAVRGGVVLPPRSWREADLMATVNRIVRTLRELDVRNHAAVKVDDVGVGGGVVDRLRQLGYPVTPVNFGARAADPERFANVRAEAFWTLREFVRREAVLPSDDGGDQGVRSLVADLTAHRLDVGARQDPRIRIEPKEHVKARLGGRSPDHGDALALAVYEPQREVVEVWDAREEFYGLEPIVPGLD